MVQFLLISSNDPTIAYNLILLTTVACCQLYSCVMHQSTVYSKRFK